MTINIALVTSEAIVFGCDSIASKTEPFLNVLDHIVEPDNDGRMVVKFDHQDLTPVVTNSWTGVRKMFSIGANRVPVVAVTAGLAKLNGRTISSLGSQFYASFSENRQIRSVETVGNHFLEFMRGEYDNHYNESPIPEEFRDGPEFLIGGVGQSAEFPSLYSIKVKENQIQCIYSRGKTGISWNGQSDAVERIIRGIDYSLYISIQEHIQDVMIKQNHKMQAKMDEIIISTLEALGAELPEDIDTEIPLDIEENFSVGGYGINVEFSNLPLQEAVNMVSYLVLVQAGKGRFEQGVATVGGRTHIAVVTKENGIQVLNEPKLSHRYIGFSDET